MTEQQTETSKDGPAFPYEYFDPQLQRSQTMSGMTLRDYFAAKAMKTYSDDTDELLLENAIRAYKQADAMIKARQA